MVTVTVTPTSGFRGISAPSGNAAQWEQDGQLGPLPLGPGLQRTPQNSKASKAQCPRFLMDGHAHTHAYTSFRISINDCKGLGFRGAQVDFTVEISEYQCLTTALYPLGLMRPIKCMDAPLTSAKHNQCTRYFSKWHPIRPEIMAASLIYLCSSPFTSSEVLSILLLTNFGFCPLCYICLAPHNTRAEVTTLSGGETRRPAHEHPPSPPAGRQPILLGRCSHLFKTQF